MSNSTTKALWEVSKELDISYTDLLILARLADRQNEISKLCCPSCESLAEDCKVNEKTVRRAIKVLRNEGLITTTPNGRGFNFVFHLTEPKTPSESGTSLSDQVGQSRPANEVLRSDNDVLRSDNDARKGRHCPPNQELNQVNQGKPRTDQIRTARSGSALVSDSDLGQEKRKTPVQTFLLQRRGQRLLASDPARSASLPPKHRNGK